jgi:hypothetical protein
MYVAPGSTLLTTHPVLLLYVRWHAVVRYAVGEAFAALLELAPDATWDRLVRDAAPGSLLHALSGGLGPSHRASVVLLGQMPRSSRGTQLRQLGALQLLSKLIPGAKQQVSVWGGGQGVVVTPAGLMTIHLHHAASRRRLVLF